jgi:thioredoxin reductase
MPRKKIVFPTKPRRVRRSTKQGKLRLKELREKRRDRELWQKKFELSRHHKAGIPTNTQDGDYNNGAEYVPRVAIIGGGAGGLVSLRYCLAAGLNAILFEQNDRIGGVWCYNKADISDSHKRENGSLGALATRPRSKSPMYESLITNLPKEIMPFFDFPFKQNLPSFVTHEDMLSYLYEYAYHNHLMEHIRCSKPLIRMWQQTEMSGKTKKNKCSDSSININAKNINTNTIEDFPTIQLNTRKWMLEFGGHDNKYGYTTTHTFDAVIIANGHYNRPHFPNIPGSDHFPGRIIHSIDFDKGSDFQNKNVLILGAKASGTDIALQIKKYARKVFVCDKYFDEENQDRNKFLYLHENVSNVFWHSGINKFNSDGSVDTTRGNHIENVDVVICCTGYHYDFPFFRNEHFPDGKNIVHESGRRVNHLYKQCIYKKIPSLAFVGLPYSVVPFQLVELQARWISSFFAGEIDITLDDSDIEDNNDGDDENISHAHFLGPKQWEYCKDLIDLVGDTSIATGCNCNSNTEGKRLVCISDDELRENRMTVSLPGDNEENDGMFIPYDIPTKEELVSSLQIHHEIYQHVSLQRPKYVGGDALYKNTFYKVENFETNGTMRKTWRVLNDEEAKRRKEELKNYYDRLDKKNNVSKNIDNNGMNQLKKMKKLLSKMKNIEAQLPTIPTTKQWDECLIGIERCATWWHELMLSVEDPATLKNYSLKLWMLVQHSMQSGPLINSKPAYFKRTEYVYIRRSYNFLQHIDMIGELGFSETQKKRLEQFLGDCKKAMAKAMHKSDADNMQVSLDKQIKNIGNKKKMKKSGKKKRKT